ncbi:MULTISPECIES: hypothetical protein [Aerococcus]
MEKILEIKEIETAELNGDGAFLAGAATGVIVGGVIWVAVAT